MKITAAVAHTKSQPFTIEELELDEPRSDEVLVRTVATGICHTDLTARDQNYPFPLPAVLGHEGAGVVERLGKQVTKVQPGDHVVLSYHSCGICDNCKKGYPFYCEQAYGCNFRGAREDGSPTIRKNGETIHGAFFNQSSFATYALASERNVVKVRKDAPLEKLGPLGCGIQTGAGAVMNSLRATVGSSIAVFGSGSVGLSAIMAAVLAGCTTIIAVDIQPNRLDLALELGATHTVNATEVNPVEVIQEITSGGTDYSLEAVGTPSAFRQAVDALRVPGVCGLAGSAPLGVEVNLDMNNILFGRTVRGVVEGDSVPDIFIPSLIELYMEGRFPFDRLIKFYALEGINQACTDSEKGDVVKPVLRFENK